MKKCSILSAFLFLATFLSAYAQAPVALHHGGSASFYYTTSGFQDAYNASSSGDTIYLPGGFYSGITIDKKLTIIGAGFHPDSTQATFITQINGSIILGPNADSSHIEGLYITGNMEVLASNNKVDNLKIVRNLIDGSVVLNGDRTNPSLQVLIHGNVIRSSIDLSNTLNTTISNNILQNAVHNGFQSSIRNNAFSTVGYVGSPYYGYTYFNFMNCNFCEIRNNMFLNTNTGHFWLSENNLIEKNIICYGSITWGNNIYTGNWTGLTAANILMNFSSGSYLPSDNYHLQNPAMYVGTDSTQVGIYGGLFPFKEGAVPCNPHISSKNVAPSTDANGNLNINFKVIAQPQ